MRNNNRAEVRQFLTSVREARFMQQRCSVRLKELESQAAKVTAQMNGMPGGGSGDLHKDGIMIALAMQRDRLAAAYREAMATEDAVEAFIQKLPTDSHRCVLRLRYIECLRWPDVLCALANAGLTYSERQMYRLHGEALEQARKLWEQMKETEDEDSSSQEENQP